MSKALAISMLLVEAAKRSFSSHSVRTISKLAWSETCRDPKVHKFVATNLSPSEGLLKRLVALSPTASDFEELHIELLPRINSLSKLDEVQAIFHGYAAEILLYGELCGIFSEAIEEIAIEKLTEELESLI
jgi:hypothetical protein